MMRHCNGEDVNLRMYWDMVTNERTTETVTNERTTGTFAGRDGISNRPCNCGLRFDDVERMTYWPHERV